MGCLHTKSQIILYTVLDKEFWCETGFAVCSLFSHCEVEENFHSCLYKCNLGFTVYTFFQTSYKIETWQYYYTLLIYLLF